VPRDFLKRSDDLLQWRIFCEEQVHIEIKRLANANRSAVKVRCTEDKRPG
jgi:hypothetical protein